MGNAGETQNHSKRILRQKTTFVALREANGIGHWILMLPFRKTRIAFVAPVGVTTVNSSGYTQVVLATTPCELNGIE